MCQWFAPTKLVISFETEGKGRFTTEQIEKIVVKDENGKVVSLDLPTKFILIANHQASDFLPLLPSLPHTGSFRSTPIGGTPGASHISLVNTASTIPYI